MEKNKIIEQGAATGRQRWSPTRDRLLVTVFKLDKSFHSFWWLVRAVPFLFL